MELGRVLRSPGLAPAGSLAATVLLVAANPAGEQALRSLYGGLGLTVRLIPLSPSQLVPTEFAKWLLGCALFACLAWIASEGSDWRTWFYGVVLLAVHAVFSLIFWTTTVQWWASSRWRSDAAQGWFIIAFVFAYTLAVVWGARSWVLDIRQGCPKCLERLCLAMEVGREHGMLVETSEIQSVCIHGHGTMSHTRWSHSFRPVTGFWHDLLK